MLVCIVVVEGGGENERNIWQVFELFFFKPQLCRQIPASVDATVINGVKNTTVSRQKCRSRV